MLGFLFGFNARLGRLHYFLSSVAPAIAMTLIAFAIASFAYQHTTKGAEPVNLLTWPVICAGAVFFWITFTLQSMRILDIGWGLRYSGVGHDHACRQAGGGQNAGMVGRQGTS
jgi:uncharacterized membrane protein YhaH (DUF805 family)